jgi:hypothetical protein
MRRLRKCSKGWNINVEGRYKRLRRGLLDKVAAIDIKSESWGLSAEERIEKMECENKLELMREEEIKLR